MPLLPVLQFRGPSLSQLGRPRRRTARHRRVSERGARRLAAVTAADFPSDLKDDVAMIRVAIRESVPTGCDL